MHDFHVQCGMSPEQKEMIHNKIVECAAKEGGSDADVQAIMAHTPPTTHAGKCVGACVAEAGGLVSHL